MTASSKLNRRIEQPLKSSGPCSGANPSRWLPHDSFVNREQETQRNQQSGRRFSQNPVVRLCRRVPGAIEGDSRRTQDFSCGLPSSGFPLSGRRSSAKFAFVEKSPGDRPACHDTLEED